MDKRVVFKNGQQKQILDEIQKYFTIQQMAALCSRSERTIRDWKREKFFIDFESLAKLCRGAKVTIPKIAAIELRDKYWYVQKGARRGGHAVMEKYGSVGGDLAYRKKRWREWWERFGKYKLHSIVLPRPIHIPKPSKELAEFVGIILGDGGISLKQLTVTLHHKDDLEYSKFILKLFTKLFHIEPSIRHRKEYSVITIVASRVKLVEFCIRIGLKIGNKIKQQVDIPKWIKNDHLYSVACLRGLVDTDGTVIVHQYMSNKKYYTYKKLGFTSRSHPLLGSVGSILTNLGIKWRLNGKYDIRIESEEGVKKYFTLVSTHNPKHLKRYRN